MPGTRREAWAASPTVKCAAPSPHMQGVLDMPQPDRGPRRLQGATSGRCSHARTANPLFHHVQDATRVSQ